MKNTSYEHTTAFREKLNSIFNRLRRCKSRAATGRAGELLQWERLGGAYAGTNFILQEFTNIAKKSSKLHLHIARWRLCHNDV